MPVTRSRTSSEQSAPEIASEDVKQVEEDKEISLTTPKADAVVQETKIDEPEDAATDATTTTPAETEEKEETPAAAERVEAEEAKEEANNVDVEPEDAPEKTNGAEVEAAEVPANNGLNKRKSVDGEAPEVPDSTEVVVKKAKVDEVPVDKVAEVASEEAEKPAVEASA